VNPSECVTRKALRWELDLSPFDSSVLIGRVEDLEHLKSKMHSVRVYAFWKDCGGVAGFRCGLKNRALKRLFIPTSTLLHPSLSLSAPPPHPSRVAVLF